MFRTIVRALFVIAPCLALIVGLVVARPFLQTQAASSGDHHFSSTQITCGQWNLIPNTSRNSALWGVTGISINDAWAVGFTEISGNPNNRQPLTMHWNGSSWSSVPNPSLAGTYNVLNAVAATATNDVWAVGERSDTGGALIEHWDGTAWNSVQAPSAGISSVLYGVASVPGTNQVWAVGNYEGNNSYYALIDYWDGTQWNVLSSPSVNNNNAVLQSVTAFSATDAWVVGSLNYAGNSQTLIEHWDGTSWSIVPSPNASSTMNMLFSVTPVPNTNELWAVGDQQGAKSDQTLIEHWDGSTWQVVPSANAKRTDLLLSTVAIATDDIWSVGFHDSYLLIEHWDGVRWSIVSPPASTTKPYSHLWSVSRVPNETYIWAVGYFYTASNKMFHALTMLYC